MGATAVALLLAAILLSCPWSPLLPAAALSTPSRRSFLERATTVATAAAAATTVPAPGGTASALSPPEASFSYDAYAPTYDALDGGPAAAALGIDAARSELLSAATGRVLEVGAGTGLSVGRYRYGSDAVTSLTLVDVSGGMLSEAKARVEGMRVDGTIPAGIPVALVRADATSDLLQRFGPDSFDTVVDTFSLCVMGDVRARMCIDQMRRVVKPQVDGGVGGVGGPRILLLENSRSSNPWLGRYQDLTAKVAADMGGKGCVYNQDVAEIIRSVGGLTVGKEVRYAAGVFRSFVVTKDA